MPRTASPPDTTETLVDIVEARLRDDIINGWWKPGARLGVDELRGRYGSGATPIREALSRLLSEGLVIALHNRGFRVPPLNYDDLLDISRTRAAIEAAAACDAAEHGGIDWERGLIAAFAQLQHYAEQDLSADHARQGYYDAHHAFHAALLSGCRSPRLMALQARLEHQHSRYYRQLPFARIPAADLVGVHQDLLQAALEHDGPALSAMVAGHIMLTANKLDPSIFSGIVDVMASSPDR